MNSYPHIDASVWYVIMGAWKQTSSSITASPLFATHSRQTEARVSIIRPSRMANGRGESMRFTGRFGKRITALSQQDVTFTTGTATRSTTTLPTSNALPRKNMVRGTEAKRRRSASGILRASGTWLPSGTPPPRDSHGIRSMASGHGKTAQPQHTPVTNAGKHLRASITEAAHGSVHGPAYRSGMKRKNGTTRNVNALSVGLCSRSINRGSKSPARVSVGGYCAENKNALAHASEAVSA